MDFDPGAEADPTFGITVAKGATLRVDLQWAEPWNGVRTDLDAFLLDGRDEPLKVEAAANPRAAASKTTSRARNRRVLPGKTTPPRRTVHLAINRFELAATPGSSSP